MHKYLRGFHQVGNFVSLKQATYMPFVLNDEDKVNSYGFRIRNTGIDLSRFRSNPVILEDHFDHSKDVIGRWNDIQLSGTTLTAVPEFDMDDPDAAKVAGKVDRGFVKGASMGILFNPQDMQYESDGTMVLNKCELIEASIVAIPSNANALRLYQKTENGNELMTPDQVKVCLSQSLQNFKPDNTMKKVFLSTAALIALALTDRYDAATGIDQSLVDDGITKLKNELDTVKADLKAKETALKTITDQAAATKKLTIEKKVDDAIKEGRFDAVSTNAEGKQIDNRAEFITMGLANEATLDAVIAALPAKKSLGAGVHNNANPGNTGEVKTMEDFQKLNEQEQLAFKAANPEAYKKIVAAA